MPSLQIRTGEIKLEVLDDRGETRGYFTFNPEDIHTAKQLANVRNEFNRTQAEFEKRSETCETPEEQINLLDEVCDYYNKLIDDCFGEGSSKTLFGNSKTLTMYADFLNGIAPYYKEASEKRLAKYNLDK